MIRICRTLQFGLCLALVISPVRLAADEGKKNGPAVRLTPATENPGAVTSLLFSPDGKSLAVGHFSQQVLRLWEPATGKALCEANVVGTLPPVFSADGGMLALQAGASVAICDARTGKLLRSTDRHPWPIVQVAFVPDGKSLQTFTLRAKRGGFGDPAAPPAKEDDPAVRTWDVATGKQVRRLTTMPAPPGYSDRVLQAVAGGKREADPIPAGAVTFTSDGRLLATVSLEGGNWTPGNLTDFLVGAKTVLRVWDTGTGTTRLALESPEAGVASPLRLTSDGKLLLFGHKDGLGLLEVATGKKRAHLRVEGYPDLAGAALAPNGARFAVACRETEEEKSTRRVYLIDLVTGRSCGELRGAEGATALAFSPDGSRLACGHADGSATIWDVSARFRSTEAVKEWNAKEAETLRADLAKEDAETAFRAMARLAGEPARAVPLLKEWLPAQAGDAERLQKWLAEMDSNEFANRERAAEELTKLGEEARPAIERALAGKPSAEVRRQLERVLEKLSPPRFLPSQLRVVRSVELLQRLGTPEARRLLEAIAAGKNAFAARQAEAALAGRVP